MKLRKLFFAITVMAMMVAGMTLAVDRTYTGASKSNGDSWNTASNWTPSGVPSGTDNVFIPASKYVTADSTATPTYSGSLVISNNATLQCGYAGDKSQAFNALGTPGTSTITMQEGAFILTRGGFTKTIPAIALTGNVRFGIGASSSGSPILTFSYGIIGSYSFTVQGKSGAVCTLNTTANTFSHLYTKHEYGSGYTINANVAGALGLGDVTIRADSAGNIGANLVLGAANAMASTATLSLYGPNSVTKLKLTAANTVKRLVVDGVPQPVGTYGKTGSGAQYPVSWIDSTSTALLTVTGAPAQYWDLDDSTPGAGSTAGDASGTWNGANTFWNNAAGDGTAALWTSGQVATFAAGTDATGTYTVTVSGMQDIGGLGFEEGAVTLSGDGLRMTADSVLAVASSATGTVSSIISSDATRQLIKVGTGTLTLSGASTYTGITRVDQGILSVASLANAASDSPIGNYPTAGAGGLLIGGGTFQYTGSATSVNRGFSVAGNAGIDIQTASTVLTMGDVESINQPSTLTVTGGTGSSLTIGQARIVEAAQLTLNPTTIPMTVGSANGYTSYSSSSILTLGGTATGNVVNGVINVTNPPDSGDTQSLSLFKTGSGDWTLKGASNYGGNTTVQAGNLIAGINALNNTAGAFGQQNNVDLNLGVASGNSNAGILIGGAYTIGRTIRNATANTTDAGSRVLTLGGTTAHSSIYSAAIYLGTASQTTKGVTLTAANGGTVTFSGVIQDPTGQDTTETANARALTTVTKTGLGTVALTAANAYIGGTLVSEGTLSLGNNTANSSLSNYGDLSVASGAVLKLNFSSGNADTVLRLFLGGSPTSVGQYGHTASGADNGGAGVGVYDAYFSGTGIINNLGGILVNEYLWDGGIVDIGTDGNAVSAGGTGTWNTTTNNWDKGLTAHAAWGNTTSDTAVFGGDANAAYTVTASGSLNIKELTFNTLGAEGPRYTIDGGTLNFGAGGVIRNANNQYDQTITSAITGSPAVNIKDFGAAGSYLGLKFAPSSGTQTLGAVLNPEHTAAHNTDKAGITLAGSTTGNSVVSINYGSSDRYGDVVKDGTGEWTVGNVNTGTIRLKAGKLIANGTTISGYTGFLFTGGTLAGMGTVSFASTANPKTLTVPVGAILEPGNLTGTLTLDSTVIACAINGTLKININGAQVGKLAVNPSATLTISSATLNVNVTATPTAPVVIATYGVGKRTGTFVSNNLPGGWTIDYAANSGTAIVLTPPPSGTLIMFF